MFDDFFSLLTFVDFPLLSLIKMFLAKKLIGGILDVVRLVPWNGLLCCIEAVVCLCSDLKTDGFSIESCRGMVAVMDSDSTGKLGFHEFKFLWNNIKKWQGIYISNDADCSGVISSRELSAAFKSACFPLNDQLFQLIVRRYSDEQGNMDFDNFIGCLVRLDAMCRAFKTLDKDNNGKIKVNIQEWLQLTMHS
ncbi:unnamed protein product [Oncorhynchus mykiss]|uniref:EF-hand domain-containing protein n=1 Tax=Oncorhynchus mykiss TaxID=8022 RepID=A0A060W792_ONCMY|nr:unnamed protein product [Oncorhynchus mykiss]